MSTPMAVLVAKRAASTDSVTIQNADKKPADNPE
jgi:hypothetical protein